MTTLSTPLTFTNGPAMANRMMLAPLTNMQSHEDGTISEDEHHWLVKRAEGGFGLVMTCAAHVQSGGKGFPGQLGVFSDTHLPGLERLASAIRAKGSLSSVQLYHGGERSEAKLTGEDVVTPWGDAEAGNRALSTGEVQQLIADFVAAAVRAEQAGFDGVELHGAHGYLLCQFLDEGRNQRTDGYGGDYEGRTRIIREIISETRAATRPDFQIGLRLSPERFGVTLASAKRFATEVMTGGAIDFLDMSLWSSFKPAEEDKESGIPLIDHFTALPRGDCRLGVAGKLMTAADAQKCLDHGADFVLIGRGAILHHNFASAVVANPNFETRPLPVTRDYLRGEGLGEPFVDYMANGWKGYVAG